MPKTSHRIWVEIVDMPDGTPAAGTLFPPPAAASTTPRLFNPTDSYVDHGQSTIHAFDEILAITSSAAVDDWDGFGARRIPYAAVVKAQEFLPLIPADLPTPEVGVSPRGHVTMDWEKDQRHSFSVAIASDGMVYFASFLGDETSHGRAPFSGLVIPEGVLLGIRRTYGLATQD